MKIALVGDTALFGRYCITREKNLVQYFRPIVDYFHDFDLVIANLEAPFALNERPLIGKSATVKSHPGNIELLQSIGITHVNLANNHIGDYGPQAYERTKHLLEEVGIGWFGTEEKQIELECHKEKIALLGYCSHNTNPSPVRGEDMKGLNYLNATSVRQKLIQNSKRGYFNILSVHSGQEHVHLPSSDDVSFARGISRELDYVYVGHHPHVIQGFELINNSALYYSLGNFIFDDVYTARDKHVPLVAMSESNKTGIVGTIEIKEGRIRHMGALPIYLGVNQIEIGSRVKNHNIQKINNHLNKVGSSEYENFRETKIKSFIEARRQKRDFKWYLRRLNFNSLGIIIKARLNSKRYKKEFVSQITQLGYRP